MVFYCVFCNRERNGQRNSPEEKTKEHFIPQSIGGKWNISACKACNSYMGQMCDNFFGKVAYTYKIFLRGIIIMDGVAELVSGKRFPVIFKYQTTHAGHHQFFWCKGLKSKKAIPRKFIRTIEFKVKKPDDANRSFPALAKMTLGAAYYLIKRNKKWSPSIESIFSGLAFADLRRTFLKEFNPGESGRGSGAIMRTLTQEEVINLLCSRNESEQRRHYISIEDTSSGLQVILCLYCGFFWKITIPNISLRIKKLEDELILYDLTPIDPLKPKNLLHLKDTIIKIGINLDQKNQKK